MYAICMPEGTWQPRAHTGLVDFVGHLLDAVRLDQAVGGLGRRPCGEEHRLLVKLGAHHPRPPEPSSQARRTKTTAEANQGAIT